MLHLQVLQGTALIMCTPIMRSISLALSLSCQHSLEGTHARVSTQREREREREREISRHILQPICGVG